MNTDQDTQFDDELESIDLDELLKDPDEDLDKQRREDDIRIPKARFDEAVSKERSRADAAEQRIQEMEDQMRRANSKPDMPSIAEVRSAIAQIEDKYEEALVDGDREEARKLRGQLNELRDYQRAEEQRSYASNAQVNAVESSRYDRTLIEVEASYAALNPDSDAFDREATEEVAQLVNAFVGQGVARATALTRAARYVLGAPPKADNRSGISLRQPPSMQGGGRAGASPAASITAENIGKLDERTLAKLRGDTL